MAYEASRRVETTARSFEIIEYFRQNGKSGVSRIANELEMSKGIVHNHLSTLRELGYVRKVGSDYGLSPKLFVLGTQARTSSQLYKYSVGALEEFASKFDSEIILAEHTEHECIVTAAHGLTTQRDIGVGSVLSRFNSLPGVVTLNREECEMHLSESVYTDVFTQLGDQGYAAGPVSESNRTHCVGFPVLDEADVCRGSLCILSGDGELSAQLTESVNTLRNRIEDRFHSDWTTGRSFATEKHSWVWE